MVKIRTMETIFKMFS